MSDHQRRIMVVEDQAFFSQLLDVILGSAGFHVRILRDGESAILIERTYRPDLVILDIDLPGISGLDVLRELRTKSTRLQLPIMMASARGDPSTIDEAVQLGANAFLKKPYSISQLISRVSALLSSETQFVD